MSPRVCLPLRRVGCALSDDYAPRLLVTTEGVVIRRYDRLSLHSHDLAQTHWVNEIPGWPDIKRFGQSVVTGAGDAGPIVQVDLRTGAIVRRCSQNRVGSIVMVSEEQVVISRGAEGCIEALDWEGHRRWQVSLSGHAITTREQLVIAAERGEVVVALDIASGEPQWSFRASKTGDGGHLDHSNVINPGLPSLSVLDEAIVAVTMDSRVFVLDRTSGEIVRQGQPGVRGLYSRYGRAVVFQTPFDAAEFDLDRMRDSRQEHFRDLIVPLYGSHGPSVRASAASEDVLIWTTAHGSLMGVERATEIPAGERAAWSDVVPNALMPIGLAPIIHGRYVYLETWGKPRAIWAYEST